jgi:hypothetical protein
VVGWSKAVATADFGETYEVVGWSMAVADQAQPYELEGQYKTADQAQPYELEGQYKTAVQAQPYELEGQYKTAVQVGYMDAFVAADYRDISWAAVKI